MGCRKSFVAVALCAATAACPGGGGDGCGRPRGDAAPAKSRPDGPFVVVEGAKITVDGVARGATDGVKPGAPNPLPALFDALVAWREAWERAHPYHGFSERVVLRVEAATPTAVFLSILGAAERAGYPFTLVETSQGLVPVFVYKGPLQTGWASHSIVPELHVTVSAAKLRQTVLEGLVVRSDAEGPRPVDLVGAVAKTLEGEEGDVILRLDDSLPFEALLSSLHGLASLGRGSVIVDLEGEIRPHRAPLVTLDRHDDFRELQDIHLPETATTARDQTQRIDHELRLRFFELRACYERGLARDLALDGSLQFVVTVDDDGAVSELTTEGGLDDADVVRCLEGKVRAFHLPLLAGLTFRYPMTFLPLPGGPPKAVPDERDDEAETTKVRRSGDLPREVIQHVVQQRHGHYRACHVEGLARDPDLASRIEVTFLIGRDGTVASAEAEGPIDDAKVRACVSDAFRKLSFPRPRGGVVTVRYPLVFRLTY